MVFYTNTFLNPLLHFFFFSPQKPVDSDFLECFKLALKEWTTPTKKNHKSSEKPAKELEKTA